MRIMTFNCNGIRAAQEGLFRLAAQRQCRRDLSAGTKAQEHQLGDPVFRPEGYQAHYFDAVKKAIPAPRCCCGRNQKGQPWPGL